MQGWHNACERSESGLYDIASSESESVRRKYSPTLDPLLEKITSGAILVCTFPTPSNSPRFLSVVAAFSHFSRRAGDRGREMGYNVAQYGIRFESSFGRRRLWKITEARRW